MILHWIFKKQFLKQYESIFCKIVHVYFFYGDVWKDVYQKI